MRLILLPLLAALPLASLAQVTPPGATLPATPPAAAPAQEPTHQPDKTSGKPRDWSLHFQQTVIKQWHGEFNSPTPDSLLSPLSLRSREKAKLSLTTTLFIGRRLWRGGALYFNPEVSGGSGLSAASGVAGALNGETFRVGSTEPALYLARLFLQQRWALDAETATDEDDLNQLAGPSPTHYLGLVVGKISIADYFDQNNYSHNPRTQFVNWSLMSTGAWDYPANTRGYTVGAVAEYVASDFALRVASTLVPTYANGPVLDYRYAKAHAETVELTKAYHLAGHSGTVRLLGFRTVAPMGNYRTAVRLGQATGNQPDIVAVRHDGHTKIGFGLNAEQEITREIGLFARLSYNDGINETWAFTEIDQSVSLGAVSTGARWQRPNDRLGAAVVLNGISPEHRDYLGAGGYGFIVGDGLGTGYMVNNGALSYGLEQIGEVYYSIALPRYHAAISPDYQLVVNPAYNRDRSGPVHVVALRLHIEF